MYDCLLLGVIISCVCMFNAGLCDEDCEQTILARRQEVRVTAGGALSLSCVVRHCGLKWTGTWLWKNSTDQRFSTVNDTGRSHLIKVSQSASETQLTLKILKAKQVDEGSYRCSVTWGGGNTDEGHLISVNITAAVLSQRDFLHRILVYAGAVLCLPIILGLACCLNSKVKRQLLPRAEFIYSAAHREEPQSAPPRRPVPQERNFSPRKAPPQNYQKIEVVNSDISQDALHQQGATREPVQSTLYSLLAFH